MAAATLTLGLAAAPAFAQKTPREDYLRYIPLDVPRPVDQTAGSAFFHLFGDPTAADYRDANGDGIDDRRHAVLGEIASRFAPFMVLNSTMVPLDMMQFVDADGLQVDTWDTQGESASIMRSEFIRWSELGSACEDVGGDSADCRLIGLLQRYDPNRLRNEYWERSSAGAKVDSLQILYFELPGDGSEKGWREIYRTSEKALPAPFAHWAQLQVHPFIDAVRDGDGKLLGYDFVIQYWFFYPLNDGGNNHFGDWEHINVLISPLAAVGRPMTAEEIRSILRGEGLTDPDVRSGAELVIDRVEYYFHSKVYTLDFGRPNVYQNRDVWERQVDSLAQETEREKWFWEHVRFVAYADEGETRINTHSVAYIGADNKGTDQALKPPGGKNRDSHATYPFPGLWKDIGPAGAAEQVQVHFDHRAWYAAPPSEAERRNPDRFRRGHAEPMFDQPDKVRVIPDWESVVELVQTRPESRREWAWLVLPAHWGYPTVVSPFAGIIEHAETGNLSVVGPSYNSGWNRSGATDLYKAYAPLKFSAAFPLAWQDRFDNTWGYFNLTLPTMVFLPPIDLLWQLVGPPLQALFGRLDPVFYPTGRSPVRFFGLVGGVTVQRFPTDYVALMVNQDQASAILNALATVDTIAVGSEQFADLAVGPFVGIDFYVGDRFSSRNTVRHTNSSLGADILFQTGETARLETDLNFWEYAGTLRWNFLTRAVLPYLQGGYGSSWYRVENVTVDGQLIDPPDGPWVRKPGNLFDIIWPDTWHLGAGVEWLPVRSRHENLFRGIDIGLRFDAAFYWNRLGLDVNAVFVDPDTGLQFDLGREANPEVRRFVTSAGISVSY